ncbi:MAG: hypothetical protein KatS3mg105_0060 [Gemmatales bacterium]|nr:MAG: hypothetical protein KatS3mg105_0060 [Gemmatales bacterium]
MSMRRCLSLLTELGEAVVGFWVQPIRAEPIALFRIAVGAVGILSLLLSLGPLLERYAGENGLCPPEALGSWVERSGRFSILYGPTNLPFLENWLPEEYSERWKTWAATPTAVRQLYWVWLAAMLGVTLGFWTRLSTVLAWVCAVSLHVRLPWILNGGDEMLRMSLFHLMLMPSGAVWSIDHWRRLRRRRGDAQGPVFVRPWSVRLLQLQLCAIYFFTGLSKLGSDWITGEAVYWVLNDISLTRWSYASVPIPMFLCRCLSWGTLLFEIGFPFAMIVDRVRIEIPQPGDMAKRIQISIPVRRFYLMGGLLFHSSIWATMEIGYFSQLMMCWYLVFLPDDFQLGLFSRKKTDPIAPEPGTSDIANDEAALAGADR